VQDTSHALWEQSWRTFRYTSQCLVRQSKLQLSLLIQNVPYSIPLCSWLIIACAFVSSRYIHISARRYGLNRRFHKLFLHSTCTPTCYNEFPTLAVRHVKFMEWQVQREVLRLGRRLLLIAVSFLTGCGSSLIIDSWGDRCSRSCPCSYRTRRSDSSWSTGAPLCHLQLMPGSALQSATRKD
jgi:hypothetical protein